jgi:hypothetical protein
MNLFFPVYAIFFHAFYNSKHSLSLCKQNINYKETENETLNSKFPSKDELNWKETKR